MPAGRRSSDDTRIRGLGLAARFSLTMTVVLALVMVGSGYLLFSTARTVSDSAIEEALADAAVALAENERNLADPDSPGQTYNSSGTGTRVRNGVERFDLEFRYGRFAGQPGVLYQASADTGKILVPSRGRKEGEKNLWAIFWAVTALVIFFGAGAAYVVATQVTKPIKAIVDDVRTISRGHLGHHVRAQGGGEVALLGRAIDRMAGSLAEAQEAEIELGMRERELEVAHEVRAALLPGETPALPGYEIADLHIGAQEPGGDFHDYIFRGRETILLVCEVEGSGVPAALIGATARAYLRSELERNQPLDEALKKVNRDLARDVKRGMAVTALVFIVDAVEHTALLACAGHRLPLVRFSAADGTIRKLHPEGIALGFDKGPVFERRLQLLQVPLEPGDRFMLANTGMVEVQGPDGEEWGENALFVELKRASKLQPQQILGHLESSIESHAEGEPYPRDISILAIGREAEA